MIAVLFSNRSRAAYATEAADRKETYTFTDAWGLPRTWLKGEYAYLAPNAGHLSADTIARIERWLEGADKRLIVTGKTNLPPRLLGLTSCTPAPSSGFTGWRWLPGSPFANDDWEKLYVSSYKAFTVQKVEPAPGSKVLAALVELTGDLETAATAT